MEKNLSSKIVYECPLFKVEEAEVELSDESTAKRWYIVKNDAVAIVCVQNGKIILTREFRSASGEIAWRIPAGKMEDDESPEETAVRETREEIGLEPLDLKLVQSFRHPSSYIKQGIHFFLATEFKENPLDSGEKEEEHIEIHRFSLEEVRQLIIRGEITDDKIVHCLRSAIPELR